MIAQLIAAGVLLVFASTSAAFVMEYRDSGSSTEATEAAEDQNATEDQQQSEEQAAPEGEQAPAQAPTPRPEVTAPPPPPHRTNCNEIRGTNYLSPQERSWFLTNCR